MRKLVYILFLMLLSVNLYAQNIGGPIVRGVEPKEPKPLGEPKHLDPFNNPDEVDEPYIEDPDMTRCRMKCLKGIMKKSLKHPLYLSLI